MSNNPRIALYKEAMGLEEQRARLQAELDRLTSRLSQIKDQLFDAEAASSSTGRSTTTSTKSSSAPSPASTPSAPSSAPAKSSGRRSSGRSRRGELKAQVLRALVAAGSAGVRVKDLAATLGTKPANIYSWFQTAPKRMPQIKKIGEAHYRLEGSVPETELAGPPPKPPTRRGRRSTRPLSKRGELAGKITDALKAAGKEGVKVRELADKLGVKYKNLFIWFATTGKKNKAIKKVGEAHYRME